MYLFYLCFSKREVYRPLYRCHYVWTMPNHIESGLVLSRFSVFYVRKSGWYFCGLLSIFDRLCYFSLRFHPIDSKLWHNDPWELKLYAMTFLRIPSWFFQNYFGFFGSLCGSMSVQWCRCRVKPHSLDSQFIGASCFWRFYTDTLWAPIHIKIHVFSNVSMPGQRRRQWPSIEPILCIWYDSRNATFDN